MARRPIITLSTDFGLMDYYVAAVKGVLLRHCPDATLVDVTHGIAPQDIRAGSIVLERTVQSFGAGTVHLSVVDPGVGTKRRILVASVRGQWVVCPDNGLLTWTAHRCGVEQWHELTWRPHQVSDVFHARDIMAPAAGMLAAGRSVREIARPLDDPVLLDFAPATGGGGRIIHIDHFGNCTSNIPPEAIASIERCEVRVNDRPVGPVVRTYAEVPPGEVLALIGSSGLLEIAVRDGSAAARRGIRVGDRVECRPRP